MTTIHSKPIDRLQSLGFTKYEAHAYVVLLEQGEMTGYAVAKKSGVPRANIYSVLEKLSAQGVVHRMQGSKQVLWRANNVETVLSRIDSAHKQNLAQATDELKKLVQTDGMTTVFNLRRDELFMRAGQLIDTAENELLIAIQPNEAGAFAPRLQQANARGVSITTLCLEACEQPCGGCQGELYRCSLGPTGGSRWLVVVSDQKSALIGQFSGESLAEGIVTGQALIVELASAYVRQSVALTVLGDELTDKFDGLLSLRAKQLLGTFFSTTEMAK